MRREHTHGDSAPHAHEGDAPGHSHDQAATAPAAGAGAAGAAATTHKHRGIGEHAHPDDAAGHTHDMGEDRRVRERPGGGMAARLILGVIGAAGMIIGPFFAWFGGTRGTEVEFRAFFSAEAGGNAGFAASAGFTLLILGIIALIGLVFRSGWLTSLAAALGLAATILIAIVRWGQGGLGQLEIGWWIAAVGSLLALIASMFAARTRTVETRRPRRA